MQKRRHPQNAQFKCKVRGCNTPLENESQILEHMKIHSKICGLCQKSFPANWILNKHIKLYHGPQTIFYCKKCNWTNNNLWNLKQHLRRKSCVKIKPFKCTLCLYKSKSKNALSLHVKQVHCGLKRMLLMKRYKAINGKKR